MRANDFIQVLCDHIHGRKTNIIISSDLLKAAKSHQVEGIVYAQTKNSALQEAYYAAVYLDSQRRFFYQEIQSILSSKNIPFFSVKGLTVADFYPIPALRTMGDIDIITEYREDVKKILVANGYLFKGEELNEWHFFKQGIEFELHNHLMYKQNLATEKQALYFDKCWNYITAGRLDWNYHFLFLMAHLRKHLLVGIGFRSFMDIAVLIKNGGYLFDWEWIQKELNELDLFRFTQICFGLIQRWFEVEPPFTIPHLDEENVRIATAEIFENGIFGINIVNPEIRQGFDVYKSSERGYYCILLNRFIQKAFPKYEIMILFPEYKFLKGRKYILPFFWLFRFLRNVFNPIKWKKLKREISISRESLNNRKEQLRRWGL